jgi:hypothetical protein
MTPVSDWETPDYLSISVCGCTAACVTFVARGFSPKFRSSTQYEVLTKFEVPYEVRELFRRHRQSDAALQPPTQFTGSYGTLKLID